MGRLLTEQFVVIGVRANPKPNAIIASFDGESTIVQAHARRPELPDFLKMEGGVTRIGLEKSVTSISQRPHVLG
jgi:hypothetical protein